MTDLRVIKTIQHIEQAFLELLSNMPYRAITVQDILDKALVNRSTFYRHYTSKQALAEKMVNDFKQNYEMLLNQRFNLPQDSNLDEFLLTFIGFIEREKFKILALWQIKTDKLHLYDDMYQMIKHKYIEFAKTHQGVGNLDYQGHAYATFVLSNLSYTLQQEKTMSIHEIRRELSSMCNTIQYKHNQP
ncbi:Transcriptional regulator, AcrR family protein [Moraxella macacae 0408225]|uniref:Transcriptional regulator, AcrR family protein n=1 Tax=Moraxella macacae 0408225 TaxID=1230338 RepID=L2F7P0_9GAMM|nr:TetR/AcrR family transcriptional regulator [Moraxella macacae]ELA08483.1 Transcriptional regulator, AcrR family protein [Moraxella macacae 0408225]